MDRAGSRRRRVAVQLVEGPGQVDGGRSRRAEYLVGPLEILAARRSERVPIRGRDTDRGRAADDHVANRVGNLRSRPALDLDLLHRKAALIEEDDSIILEAQDPLGLEHVRSLSVNRSSARA